MIKPGDRFPSVTIKEARPDGARDVDVAALLAGKRAVDQGAFGKVVMRADGSGLLTRALGLEIDLGVAHMGVRGKRASIDVADGVVERVDVEASTGALAVSGAEQCLLRL